MKPTFLEGVAIDFVRTVTFSAAHRYFSPGFSNDENRQVYGTLYRDEGFGHNFLIEAHFAGPIDFETGMIVNLVDVDCWLRAVAQVFDHKMLNELSDFQGVAPTIERIAQVFYKRLLVQMSSRPEVRLLKVRLFEGDQTWVDYFG